MGLFGKNPDTFDKLLRAYALSQGNISGAAEITAGMQSRAAAARKQADEAERRRQLLAGLKGQGLSDEQALLVLNNAGSIGDFRQKPEQPPAFVRNLEAWNQMTPEQQRQVAQMQSVLNPGFTTGVDGQRYQNPPAQVGGPTPWQQNPGDWELVPGPSQGGAGSQAPRGFRTDIPSGNPLEPWPPRRRR